MRRMSQKKKKKTERAKSRIFDERYLGQEPEFGDAIDASKRSMIKLAALNWYSYFFDLKDFHDEVVEYAKNKEFSEKLNDKNFSLTAAKLIHMHYRGWVLDNHEIEFIQREINRVINSRTLIENSSLEIIEPPLTPSSEDDERRIDSAKCPLASRSFSQLLYELDAIEDSWLQCHEDFAEQKYSIFARQQVLREPRKNLVLVKEWLDGRLLEFTSYSEDYEGQNLRQRVSFLESARNEVDQLLLDRRKQRQPRKKKIKSADKLVAKCKYQKTSSEFKINSENPEKLIGANEAYFFNTKTRRLEHYVSGELPFSMKGTTLQNWSIDKSFRRTLRKPEETLNFILTNTSKNIITHLESLSTKTYNDLSGRLNEDTIIVRVFSGKK